MLSSLEINFSDIKFNKTRKKEFIKDLKLLLTNSGSDDFYKVFQIKNLNRVEKKIQSALLRSLSRDLIYYARKGFNKINGKNQIIRSCVSVASKTKLQFLDLGETNIMQLNIKNISGYFAIMILSLIHQNKLHILKCSQCDVYYPVLRVSKKNKFCSDKCRRKNWVSIPENNEKVRIYNKLYN